MAEARYRLRAGDYGFGPTCVECGGSKSLQAAKCRLCDRDRKVVVNGARRYGCLELIENHGERWLDGTRLLNEFLIGKAS